jgi:hypothetical protein
MGPLDFERLIFPKESVKSLGLYRECAGDARLESRVGRSPTHSRYNALYEAALLWQDDCFYGDWYSACLGGSLTLQWLSERRYHGMMLPPNPLLCNRPDKE